MNFAEPCGAVPRHVIFRLFLLSARGDECDRTLGLDIGADDYISKPFSPRELVSRVKALLRRSRPALIDDVLEFHDLVLNQTTMEITRAGQPVALGPKECRLLAILMERPGRVLSRAQLLDLVWGHNVYVEERTVDVHMSRLRKAINQPSKNGTVYSDLIRTVRAAGYALKAPFGFRLDTRYVVLQSSCPTMLWSLSSCLGTT